MLSEIKDLLQIIRRHAGVNRAVLTLRGPENAERDRAGTVPADDLGVCPDLRADLFRQLPHLFLINGQAAERGVMEVVLMLEEFLPGGQKPRESWSPAARN